jgi:Cu(I)/Ag(I) efflux system periplasmic protein CusF
MNRRIAAVLALCSIAVAATPGAALAQKGGMDHGSMGTAAQPGMMAAQAGAMTDGEVRKVDRDARKITIKHGEIRNLDMPPMTMVFQVTDAALLERVKPGDKVRFSAEKVGGAYTVTAIDKMQ